MGSKRTWTVEQKLAILQEAEVQGVTATIRKHQIYGNTFYQWQQKYATGGKDGLGESYKRIDPEMKRKDEEIRLLKELVAEKELTIRIKDDLLKKTLLRQKNGE